MAWRFVTHACGHQERINVDGPYVVVEQRVRNAERVSCPACIGIASRQRNRLDGFCELWGSKSQCDRAEPVRRRTLSQVVVNHPLTRPDGTVMPGISRLRRFDWKVGPDEGLHADDYEIWERELREQAERDRFDGELRSLGALGDGESIFGRQPGNGPSSPDGDDGVSDS